MGIGAAESTGSLSRPTQERVAYGDVTVMTARAKRLSKQATEIDTDTGEIRVRRHDPDAALHTTGGGTVVPGLPFAFTHIRGPQRNQQIMLAGLHTSAPTTWMVASCSNRFEGAKLSED